MQPIMVLGPRDVRWVMALGGVAVVSLALAFAFSWWWGVGAVAASLAFFLWRREER